MTVTRALVERAAETISGSVVRTPFLWSRTLSEIAGADLYIKFENLQYTASFKDRGALNKLVNLPADAAAAGVIAVSAGNHAQGVAYHGSQGRPSRSCCHRGWSQPVRLKKRPGTKEG